MSRRRGFRIGGAHFAMIPVEVLESEACRTLPCYAHRLLIAIAAQYRGRNNGDLAMTRVIARRFGINSQDHLVYGLAALMERGLIRKMRQGGKKPMGPTLYAVTWHPVDDLKGKIEHGPTTTAANPWASWKSPASGLPTDQTKIKHQVCRRTASGLPTDQRRSKLGLPADQQPTFIGSAGSPPSNISPLGSSPRAAQRGRL